jgi:MFS family permease
MAAQRPGWSAVLSGRNGIRSLALAGGVVLHAVNVYIATTILPSVVADIGGLDYYAWNTTLFVLASILGSALSARLLQAAGPRMAYAAAALLFALGTLICALAPGMPIMLLGRSVQGLGGGILCALSYAMIRIVFPESLWPRAMALVSGMWGIATLLGPAIGGMFAEWGAWRAAFWAVIPAAALFALLAASALPRRLEGAARRSGLPLAQLVLLMLTVLAISLGSVMPGAAWNIGGIAAALLLFAALVAVERRARHRLLPRGALQVTTPLGLLLATLSILAVTVTSSEIFVPLFLQVLHHQPPLAAGYLAALMSAGWTIGSITSSGAEGPRIGRAVTAAPVICFIGMVALAMLLPSPSDGGTRTMLPISAALLAVGYGVGIAWPHLLTGVLKAAPPGEQDLASASITTVQMFATALGAALAGLIANLGGLTAPGGVAGTAGAALWLFVTLAAGTAVGFLTATRSVRGQRAADARG